MLSYICVKQDFTAGWHPGGLWTAIFYEKHFICHMLPYKLFIWAGPLAQFGWPLFKFWLKACLCMNQQIRHVWYQSANFTLELLFSLLSFQFLTFEIKLLTARLQLKYTSINQTDLKMKKITWRKVHVMYCFIIVHKFVDHNCNSRKYSNTVSEIFSRLIQDCAKLCQTQFHLIMVIGLSEVHFGL